MEDETPQERRKRLNRERQQKYRQKLKNQGDSAEAVAKRARHAELQHIRRNRQGPEARQADNARQHQRLLQETPEASRQRREAASTSQRLRRSIESTEETRRRRETDAARQRQRLSQETPEASQQRRESAASSQRQRRSIESTEETRRRRETDATRHRQRLSQETPEASQQRRETVASSRRQRRGQETNEQRRERLSNLHRRHEISQLTQMEELHSHVTESLEHQVIEHSCGPLDVICKFCKSKNFLQEKPSDGLFTICCRKGKIKLPKPIDVNGNELSYPEFLKDYLTNPSNPLHVKFRDQIRSINNAMSFSSMGAKIVDVAGRGPYVFKIHGQTYHRTSHLEPSASQTRQYAQLYVIDSVQALSIRQQHAANVDCPSKIFSDIDQFFREHNRLAKTFQMMKEIEEIENAQARASNLPPPEISLVFKRDRQSDQRRYNDPTANEIAMIFVNEDGEPPFERDIRIYPRNPNPNQKFVQLSILSANIDPMTYALLFPYGEPGWQAKWQCQSYPNVQLNRVRTNISMQQFKVSLTAIRDYFNPIIHSGKLTQQWLVDSYLQVEANNLNFIRQNQSKLRSELYQGLQDHIENSTTNQNIPVGVPVILPSSFSGSPRNMRELCCDAMAIFANKGAPDLFVTFTSNPNWEEIKSNLEPYESASDRPDLVARVFKIKLDELINDLTKKMVFGYCVAYAFTVEFQKRGLPHAHILITLRAEDKFKTPQSIDRFVSAEIPIQRETPRLYEIVIKHMMHGPCGQNNRYAPCMENGKCKKNFPKEFCNETVANEFGYPLYRRREGTTVQVRGVDMDNRYVVPYNPFLCLKFNSHINVEVCTSIKAVKYIYKYIFKGFDCTNVAITSEGQNVKYDEVTNYINCRYVSAPEAIWRLRENKMHDKSHTVMRLPIHLPGQQRITFEEGHEEEAIIAAQTKCTKLEAFFKLNATDSSARQFLYIEIPLHYVYIRNEWKVRQRGGENTIGRMYMVSPRDEERFYLRLLLLHVRGPISFDDLRSVDGSSFPTFKMAAGARGLLESDSEWERCLTECATYQLPREMRNTFAYILSFASPSNPLALWEKFKDDFTLDFERTFINSVAVNLSLHALEQTLLQHGLNCSMFGLPAPQGIPPPDAEEYDIAQEAAEATIRMETLNEKQREAFESIRHALDFDDQESRCFFLDGPGGSGKTFVYRLSLSFVRGRGETALPFATTGIAAILLKGGRTAHSGFKLPVPLLETSVSSMRINSREANVLKEAALIIIDEITMLPKDGLRVIDKLLKEIMGNNRPFGGKVFVVGGDFRQTLPVVPHGTQVEIVESCVKSSPLWKYFKTLSLSVNMRSEGQNEHNEWLLKVGQGATPMIQQLKDPEMIEIPRSMIETGSLVDAIFGPNLSELSDEELCNRVIVTPTNAQALQINREIIGKLPGNPEIYYSADSIISEDPNDVLNYPPEFLHEQTPSGMPPHCLMLKKGVIIMLLRNLNPKEGLCNGTRLVVEHMTRSTITARIISESHRGDCVIIPRIVLAPSDSTLPFVLKRRQFPVIPAFAITINKAQGQTYDGGVGLDLQLPPFGHGQLYVGLSRARKSDRIKVKIAESNEQGKLLKNQDRYFTRNVVFKEVFNM